MQVKLKLCVCDRESLLAANLQRPKEAASNRSVALPPLSPQRECVRAPAINLLCLSARLPSSHSLCDVSLSLPSTFHYYLFCIIRAPPLFPFHSSTGQKLILTRWVLGHFKSPSSFELKSSHFLSLATNSVSVSTAKDASRRTFSPPFLLCPSVSVTVSDYLLSPFIG